MIEFLVVKNFADALNRTDAKAHETHSVLSYHLTLELSIHPARLSSAK